MIILLHIPFLFILNLAKSDGWSPITTINPETVRNQIQMIPGRAVAMKSENTAPLIIGREIKFPPAHTGKFTLVTQNPAFQWEFHTDTRNPDKNVAAHTARKSSRFKQNIRTINNNNEIGSFCPSFPTPPETL